jgi:hypothetical protein
MTGQRTIPAAALVAAALCAFAPAAGASSTLLSGYGGPGQGNQAIIGSSLVGGRGGGNGGGSGGGGSATSVPSSSSSIAVPQTQSVRPTTSAPAPRPKRHTAARHATAVRSAGPAAKAATPKLAVTALSADRGGGKALGLSGADVAYIVLAFAALALTALLTVLLTRRTGGAEGAQ